MTRILLSIHFLIIIMLQGFSARAQYDTLHLLNDHCAGRCEEMPAILGTINGNLIAAISNDSVTTLYTYNAKGMLQAQNAGDKKPIISLPITSPNIWSTASLTLNNNIYYCSTKMFADSTKLFRWDGTGVPQLKNPNNNLTYSTASILSYKDKIYLSAYQPVTFKPATFVYDPLTDSMEQVIDQVVTNGVVYKDKFYCSVFDTIYGNELYVFDPATRSLTLLADTYPGVMGSEPNSMMVVEDKLYYIATDPVYNNALYEYTGTGAPVPVVRFEKDPGDPENRTRVFTPMHHEGKLYMQCNLGFAQTRAYHYTFDLSSRQVKRDTLMDRYGANIPYTSYNGKLFFWSYTGSTWPGIKPSIYIYDVANVSVKPMPRADTSRITYFIRADVHDDALYITMETTETGMELFRYAEEKTTPVNNQATLCPNPATDKAYINTKLDASNVLTIIMHDATGRLISQQRLGIFGKGTHKVEIPLQHLAAGMYICTLRGSKNILFKGKLVKL